MSKIIEAQLKKVTKEQERLAKEKAALEAKIAEKAAQAEQFNEMKMAAGFRRPKDFIKALMEHFGVMEMKLDIPEEMEATERVTRKRAARKTAKKAAKGSGKRIRVTAELRDRVKAALAEGTGRMKVGREVGVSYPVVKKIAEGGYDNL